MGLNISSNVLWAHCSWTGGIESFRQVISKVKRVEGELDQNKWAELTTNGFVILVFGIIIPICYAAISLLAFMGSL